MREIDEFVRYSMLFSVYKPLFQGKQLMYLEAVLEQDNSFSEIASAMNVSRQAVFENVKIACKKLDFYEQKLKILNTINRLKQLKKNFSEKLLDEIILDMEGS